MTSKSVLKRMAQQLRTDENAVEIIGMREDQREILSWCSSLEEAKLNGEFKIKRDDSYFLKQVKTICQLATMDLKG